MVSFEEVGDMLDELAEEVPEEFYQQLNGGISLLPDAKPHPESRIGGPLYILGEYHVDGLGKYIVIYYGSFMLLFGYMNAAQLRGKLRETLFHEFTHHVERMAGEHGLEERDRIFIEKYRRETGV